MVFSKTNRFISNSNNENVGNNKTLKTNISEKDVDKNLINSKIQIKSNEINFNKADKIDSKYINKNFFIDKTKKTNKVISLNKLKSKYKMKNKESLSADSLSIKNNKVLKNKNCLGLNLISQFKNEKTKTNNLLIKNRNEKEDYICRICLDSITLDDAVSQNNFDKNILNKSGFESKNDFNLKTTCKSKLNNKIHVNNSRISLNSKLNFNQKINSSLKSSCKKINCNSKNSNLCSSSKNDSYSKVDSLSKKISKNCEEKTFNNQSKNGSENSLISMNNFNSKLCHDFKNKFFNQNSNINFNEENYLAPCDCKGQSKYVHKRCLNEWIYISKKTKCQVCLVNFRNIKLKVLKRSVIKWLIDEYDHLLLLILYMIPFTIDCLLMSSFLKFNLKGSLLIDNSTINSYDQNQWLLNEINLNEKIYNQTDEQNLKIPTFINKLNGIFSFINFERSKKVTSFNQTLNLDMFVHNLYFLELKFNYKNLIFSLTGIPLTILISLPSLIIFFRYCKSRYIEWQTENLDILVDN